MFIPAFNNGKFCQLCWCFIFAGDGDCYLIPEQSLTIGSVGQLTVGFWIRQFPGNTG